MSSIGSVNNTLIETQMASAALSQQISTKVASKTLDAARDQGAAAVALLDAAAQVAKAATAEQTSKPPLTFGAMASGLGQNLDIKA